MYEDPQDLFSDMDDMFAHIFTRMTRDFMAGEPQESGYPRGISRNGESSPVPCSQHEQLRAGSGTGVEVHRIDDEVKVITGLPGVTRDALHLTMKGNELFIDADAGSLQYHTSANLPPVDPDPVQVSLKNGVLEVTFRVTAGTQDKVER